MSGSLNRADSFDTFLADCFSIFTSAINNHDSIDLPCESVIESVCDFDLSLLGPVVEVKSLAEATPVTVSSRVVLIQDSVKLRISEFEDLLGAHQFEFWRASPSAAIASIVSLCRQELVLRVEETDFTLVREPDHRRYGVLLCVTSVVLKRQILAPKDIFRMRGYFVDIA